MADRRNLLLVLAGIIAGAGVTALLFTLCGEPEAADYPSADATSATDDARPRAQDLRPDRAVADRELTGDCVLAGKVMGADDEPLADALVRVRLLDEPWPTADLDLEQRTDGAGRYAFEGLAEDAEYQIWAWSPEHAVTDHEDARCGAQTDLSLEPGASLDLAFFGPDGDPVGPVEVQLAGSTLWPARSARADADGQLVFDGLAPGQYLVWATAGGLSHITAEPIEVVEGAANRAELQLEPTGSAEVCVTAEHGAPVPDAIVVVGPASASLLRRIYSTRDDGCATLAGLPPGEQTATAIAPGFASTEPKLLQSGDHLRFTLLGGIRITGTVRTIDDQPVAGATLEVAQELGISTAALPGGSQRRFKDTVLAIARTGWPVAHALDESHALPGPLVLPLPRLTRSTVKASAGGIAPWSPTDERGRFALDGLSPGHLIIGASHPDLVLDREAELTLEPGRSRVDVLVLMRAGTTAAVRTLGENGYPLRGVEVAFYDRGDQQIATTTSGTDGFTEVRGLPDRFTVEASHDGRVPAAVRVRSKGGRRIDLEITLPPADKQIRGRLVDDRGYGVSGARITARSQTRGQVQVLVADTAPDGTFVLDGAGEGPYHVVAETDGRIRAQVHGADHYEGLSLISTGGGGPGYGAGLAPAFAIPEVLAGPAPAESIASGSGGGGGGPRLAEPDFVTPEMLGSALEGGGGAAAAGGGTSYGEPFFQPRGDDEESDAGADDLGVIAISSRQERGAAVQTEYGRADSLPVTGPPAGRGGLPITIGGGPGNVFVKSVLPGSRVFGAGLRAGDRIISVDERKIHSPAQAREAISGRIGTVVVLLVEQDGERVNVVVQRVRVRAR